MAAACESLQHIFDNDTLPESPTPRQSHSPWKTHLNSLEIPSDFFGEMHLKENANHYPSSLSSFPLSSPSSSLSSSSSSSSSSSFSSSPFSKDFNSSINKGKNEGRYFPATERKHHRRSDSVSSVNSDCLSVCTEAIGLESFTDIEESIRKKERKNRGPRRRSITRHSSGEFSFGGKSKISRITGIEFPPPISSIGRNGKPWVWFKSYRNNGRIILKEIKTQEFLHASREDGRLKMHFVQSDDEFFEDEEDEDEEDYDNGSKL